MRTHRYPSDLTDEQWTLIEPLIPGTSGGRPRKTSMRDVLDAIFYVNRTDCQWRFLPKDYPPKSTVWEYISRWGRDGTLTRIRDALRQKVRRAEGRKPTPSAASIDSQSVRATEGGEARGLDAHKKVKGRKRHIVVDTLGLLLAVTVTAAGVDDGRAAPTSWGNCRKTCSRGCGWCGRTRSTTTMRCTAGWPSTPTTTWRSSAVPTGPRASCRCPNAGRWSGPSPGWAAVAGSPPTGSGPRCRRRP